MYVASFCSLCFICFFRRMLQVCLFGCCIRFTHILQVFYLDVVYVLQCLFKCFPGAFARVSEACFKCFICLQTYVANVASWYFKSRSGVAYGYTCGNWEGHEWSPGVVWWRGRCPRARCVLARAECGTRETECSAGIRRNVRALALLIPVWILG
jgi:hypothetical protein